MGHVSLDGSKVQANASKHKAMTFGRMKDEEKRLAAEIEGLLFRADQTDRHEDEQYGDGQRGDELPAEFQRRDVRLRRIREAKAALEKEAAQARAAQLRELRRSSIGKPSKRWMLRSANEPQHEPASRGSKPMSFHPHTMTMTTRVAARQPTCARIVSRALPRETPPTRRSATSPTLPMLERVREHCGGWPEQLSADTGYLSERNVAYCEAHSVDAYIAVGRKDDDGALGRLPMSAAQEVRWRMHQKITSAHGRAIYACRKVIVEPVFGQIKRAIGLCRFSLRGLSKVAAEWGIVCLCHNVLKLYRALGCTAALAS